MWTGVSRWCGIPVTRRIGSAIMLYCSARCIGIAVIPNVSDVAMRVTRTGGGGKDVFAPRFMAVSTISSIKLWS